MIPATSPGISVTAAFPAYLLLSYVEIETITSPLFSSPRSTDLSTDTRLPEAQASMIGYLSVDAGGEKSLASTAPTVYFLVEPSGSTALSATLPVNPLATREASIDDPAPEAYLPVELAYFPVDPPATNADLPDVPVAKGDGADATPPGNGGETFSSVSAAHSSSSTPRPQTGELNGVTYSIGSSSVIVNGKTIYYATPTTATVASGKVAVVDPSGAVAIQDIPGQSSPPQPKQSVTRKEYLIGAFLPTVLAVLFSIPWYILSTAVQEMEPFYQLANLQGALACNSICLDYRASLNVVAILKAGLKGHFVVLWAGLCSIAVLALAPIASETVFIGFVGEGRCAASSLRDACHPQLSVYPVAARLVQGILGLVAVLTVCIAIRNSRRNSGVYANPSSIAGIATLFQNPSLIDEFRLLDPDGFDSRALEAQLQGNRYRLSHFQHHDGSMDYGIISHTEAPLCSDGSDPDSRNSRTYTPNKRKKYITVPVTTVKAEPKQSRMSKTDYFLHPATIFAFAILVAGLLTLVVYYNQTGGDTDFERFMDSQTFGVAFMFTAVGVMLKLYWTLVDDDLRTTYPYRLLLLAASSSEKLTARRSILASPPSNPFIRLGYSLRRMTWLPFWLSLMAVLVELLIVALANIPFEPRTAYMAYRVSTYVTIGVLASMLLGLCGVLGRQKGLAELDEKSRDRIIEGWKRGYRMGQVAGVDGVERWGIDKNISVRRRRDS
ncbi:MAG: hypothetical protein Q9182_001499 [Xanthomendoza sp. 2 TL-2023]